MPGANPLRSLGEMAGKVSSDYRLTAMDLVREALKERLERRALAVAYPERSDARLNSLSFNAESAAQHARGAKLSGHLLLAEIRRWDADSPGLLRSSVDFKLVRIETGATMWERRVDKVISSAGGRIDQVSADGAREIARELFGF